jgi:hypothetical protein
MAATAQRLLRALCLVPAALLGGCSEPQVTPLDLGEPVPAACIGAEPPAAAWAADPSGEGSPPAGGPVVGDPPAEFALRDFQPQSCGYEAVYGLDVLRGRVTLIVAVESS